MSSASSSSLWCWVSSRPKQLAQTLFNVHIETRNTATLQQHYIWSHLETKLSNHWKFFFTVEEVQMNFRLNVLGQESTSIPSVFVIIFPWEKGSVWLTSILLWIFFGLRLGRERVVGWFVYFILHQYRHSGRVLFPEPSRRIQSIQMSNAKYNKYTKCKAYSSSSSISSSRSRFFSRAQSTNSEKRIWPPPLLKRKKF